MNDYEKKKQDRIDRYLERAGRARNQSNVLARESSRMLSGIPAGEPIHGPADRRYRDRSWAKMGKSVEAAEKAKYYENKARAAENNTAISSDDPDALPKLKEKLERLKNSQELMKGVNAYYRKHKTCVGCDLIFPDRAEKLDADINSGVSWAKVPYPPYELSLNNAEIHRLEDRIKELETRDEIGFTGWEFDGGRVEVNTDINRLQVFFDEIPSDETRSQLKHGGFHWSRNEGAWQRQLTNNAVYAARRVEALKPIDGSDPVKIQPYRKNYEPRR